MYLLIGQVHHLIQTLGLKHIKFFSHHVPFNHLVPPAFASNFQHLRHYMIFKNIETLSVVLIQLERRDLDVGNQDLQI